MDERKIKSRKRKTFQAEKTQGVTNARIWNYKQYQQHHRRGDTKGFSRTTRQCYHVDFSFHARHYGIICNALLSFEKNDIQCFIRIQTKCTFLPGEIVSEFVITEFQSIPKMVLYQEINSSVFFSYTIHAPMTFFVPFYDKTTPFNFITLVLRDFTFKMNFILSVKLLHMVPKNSRFNRKGCVC